LYLDTRSPALTRRAISAARVRSRPVVGATGRKHLRRTAAARCGLRLRTECWRRRGAAQGTELQRHGRLRCRSSSPAWPGVADVSDKHPQLLAPIRSLKVAERALAGVCARPWAWKATLPRRLGEPSPLNSGARALWVPTTSFMPIAGKMRGVARSRERLRFIDPFLQPRVRKAWGFFAIGATHWNLPATCGRPSDWHIALRCTTSARLPRHRAPSRVQFHFSHRAP
jgi:hypothetical protein